MKNLTLIKIELLMTLSILSKYWGECEILNKPIQKKSECFITLKKSLDVDTTVHIHSFIEFNLKEKFTIHYYYL